MIDSTTRWQNWAVGAHLTGLINLVGIPLGAPIGAAIVYLLRKDDGEYVRGNAAYALNFQLTLAIVHVLAIAIVVGAFFGSMLPQMALIHEARLTHTQAPFPFGFFATVFGMGFALVAINLGSVVYSVIGALEANKGGIFHYLAIRFVR